MSSLPSEPPIFIVGAGRSGTTLIRSLLSAHSRIAVTPETHFLKVAERNGGLKDGIPADIEAFWRDFSQSQRFKDLGVSSVRCRTLVDAQGKPTMQAVFRAILAAYGERVGKPRVGEKTPGHVDFLPDLRECFPESPIIFVRRDPRAVVASMLKSPWTQSRQASSSLKDGFFVKSRLHLVAFYARRWVEIYERILPQWAADPRVATLSYESLVHDPKGELRRLCTFLDEPYEAAMLTKRSDEAVPQPAATNDMNSRDWQEWRRVHHEKSLAPVSATSVDTWRTELSRFEVALIEGGCSRGMQAAGYHPVTSRLRRRAGRLSGPLTLTAETVERRMRERILQRTSA